MTVAKAKTPVEDPASASTDHTPSDTPTQSNARNSKKTSTAPRVLSTPSSAQPVPTHRSTCFLSSSSTLGSHKKHISANLESTNDRRTHPLLPQLLLYCKNSILVRLKKLNTIWKGYLLITTTLRMKMRMMEVVMMRMMRMVEPMVTRVMMDLTLV